MWPDATTTAELVNLAASGESGAADQLLERHREALRRMIDLRMDPVLKRRVDASDVVQDTLLDAHRRLADYLRSPQLPFHLWLRQVAQDRLIDAHRRHRGAARRSIDREQPNLAPAAGSRSALDLLGLVPDDQLTPAAAATQHELVEKFQAAVGQLDDIDRDIILMRHAEQLTNQEAAQALGLSEPAAGMRYLRAIRRLRAMLDLPPSSASDVG